MSQICLFLEGTFPYVTGGVSSCVNQLIKNTPQYQYTIFYIGSGLERNEKYKYEIPENVTHIEEFFLLEYEVEGSDKKVDLREEVDFKLLKKFYESSDIKRVELFTKVYFEVIRPFQVGWDPMKVLESQQTWDILVEFYKKIFKDISAPSFIDFFYTWRFTHYPILRLLNYRFPKASLYHSLSTGYAGLGASAASISYNRPMLLTEHGIYSHEREIEIYNASWIYDELKDFQARKNLSPFKELWIKIFHFMGLVAYRQASAITTLYQGNLDKQIKYGASEEKIQIIPNGINIDNYKKVEKIKNEKLIISIVGRVVAIKDIKCFIKSLAYLKNEIEDFSAFIIGPYSEEPEYYEECLKLVEFYQLNDYVIFTGKVDVKEYYAKTDILVLSSISEGQPMVILEAFACEIPVVSTDVGSCSELVYGSGKEDREIGAAGIIVPFGKPLDLGTAILELARDENKRLNFGQNARKRVTSFYTETQTIQSYEQLYQRYLEGAF